MRSEKTLEREETDTSSITDSIGSSGSDLAGEAPEKIIDKRALMAGMGIATGLKLIGAFFTFVGSGLLTGPLAYLIMGIAVGSIFDEGVGEAAIAGAGVAAIAYALTNILSIIMIVGLPGLLFTVVAGFVLGGVGAFGVKYLSSRV